MNRLLFVNTVAAGALKLCAESLSNTTVEIALLFSKLTGLVNSGMAMSWAHGLQFARQKITSGGIFATY